MTVVIGGKTLAEAMTVVIEMPYPVAMAAKKETKGPAGDRRRSPARVRMVRSAATLIRERGIHGTGLRQVVAHSGGPRGSLGRFFPGGKTQLVTEAIDVGLVDLFDDLERPLSEAETFPEAISVIVTPGGACSSTTTSPWAAHWPRPFATRPTTTASAPMSASCSHGGECQSPTPTPGLGRRRRKPKHTRRC